MTPRLLRWALLILALALVPSLALATPLNLILEPSPDVTAGTIDVTYNAGTQTLSASGFSLQLDFVNLDNIGFYTVVAGVDNSGTFTGSGTISITGDKTPFGDPLLLGNLTNFGWFGDGAGMLLEFEFAVTGGSLAGLFSGPGGSILSSGSSTFTDWNSSWDNLLDFGFGPTPGTGAGTSDTAPVVPEPSTGLLLALGLTVLGRRSRRSTSPSR